MKWYKLKKHIYSLYAFISILSALLLSFSAIAQNNNNSTFSLDIHAGISGNQVEGDGLSGFNKLGVFGGLGVSTELKEKWDASFELNFVQKGSVKRPDATAGDYVEYRMSLNYVQIPVIVKYKLNQKINFVGGLALARLLSSKEEDLYGEIRTDVDFEKWELSLVLGGGFQFSEKWGVNLRLDSSLLPIRMKGNGLSNRLIGRQYNSSLELFLSYSIR